MASSLGYLTIGLAVMWISAVSARGPPRVMSPVTQRQIARVGDTVRLSCPVEADPTPLLQWSKDGQSINRGWERFKMMSLSLRIKSVMEEDEGRYECKATNGFGHVTVDYILIVLHENQTVPALEEIPIVDDVAKAPIFSRPDLMSPSAIRRPIHNNIRLHCPAVGNPRPAITWYKNGRRFEVLTRRRSTSEWTDPAPASSPEYSPEYSLQLVGLTEEDSGEYECRLENTYGRVTHTYTLQVLAASDKPILVPPHPRNMTVAYGNTASFTCQVHSMDQPHIQWLKRIDAPLPTSTNNTIKVKGQDFMVLRGGEVLPRPDGSFLNKLTIERATDLAAGMYVCLGANNRGYSIRSAYLTVLGGSTYKGRGGAELTDDASFWDNNGLAVIIGVPAAVILIAIAVTICVVKRRQAREQSASTISATPASAAGHRAPQRYPANGSAPGHTYWGPTGQPHPDKLMYDHQYAALQPHSAPLLGQPQPQSATSQDRIMKAYSDRHSSEGSYAHEPLNSSHVHNISAGSRAPPPHTPTPTMVTTAHHPHQHPQAAPRPQYWDPRS